MAEGGGLLNRYTLQRRIEGSNPSVSARGLAESMRISSKISSWLPVRPLTIAGPTGISRQCRVRDERGERHPKSFGAKNRLKLYRVFSDKCLINNSYA